MREIVLDTETTGLDYKSGDRIIDVGCVELLNHIPTGKTLQFYCSTDKTIEKNASKIHGLTNEFLNQYPTFKAQNKQLLDFIKNDTLIIHNSEFDIGFINNELKLCGLPKIKNNVVDTVILARKVLKTRIANLNYLCRRFSIDISGRKIHGALLDSQLLAEVYLELMGGKQATLELSAPSKKKIAKNPGAQKAIIVSKIKATEEEIKLHKTFVKNLKNPLWQKMDY